MGLRHSDHLIATILLILFISSGNAELPEVTIPQGDLLGKLFTTNSNRTISGFLGIPYAEPPIGELRFSAPVAAGGWNTTLNASVESSTCFQWLKYTTGLVVGSEDCLYLNVYTPQLSQNANATLLPVMVYIHGGGFVTGSSTPSLYGPEFLLDKDIVLVVMNYRLGTLGFFSTGDEVASGNWGLKDAVLALEWVQNNVEYFGGDPAQVTLCGQSVGASAVQMLALSNLTIGLFHQYIMESGSALTSFYISKKTSANRAVQLGEQLGCPTNTSSNLVACLRELNGTVIMNTNSLVQWYPTNEGDVEGALLTDTPSNLFVAGQARDIPLIAGVNRNESAPRVKAFINNMDLFEELLNDIDAGILRYVPISSQYENETAFTEVVKAYYFSDLTANTSILFTNFTNLINDALYFYPTWKALQKQSSFAQTPQYFYSFEYHGEYSYVGGSTTNYGVAHCDELLYLFPETESMYGEGEVLTTTSDFAMVDIMVELWTTFTINGTPVTSALNGTWEPHSCGMNHLRIGDESDPGVAIEYDFQKLRMQFWEDLSSILATSE